VQWTTHNSSQPRVRFGARPGKPTHTVSAASRRYARSDLCGPPATTVGWVDPGTFHVAKLTGLQPGQRYYYTCGSEVSREGGWVGGG